MMMNNKMINMIEKYCESVIKIILKRSDEEILVEIQKWEMNKFEIIAFKQTEIILIDLCKILFKKNTKLLPMILRTFLFDSNISN